MARCAVAAAAFALAGAQSTYYVDDSAGPGRMFDGIGGLSGGGATSRLLPIYNETIRDEILDYLFLPNFGAALQILKVEIGGDGQSTDGSESSSMHTPYNENYLVGYEAWLMTEAKKRNPNIKLYGLSWAYPQWVSCNPGTLTNCTGSPYTYPNQTAMYISKWIAGMQNTYDLSIDYIGIWNERPYDTTYIKTLRQTLNNNGQSNVKIVAPDSGWSIAADILADPELAAAIYAIGAHYPGTTSSSQAQQTGKQLWASEDMSTYNNNVGAGCWARVTMQNYVRGLMSATISWNLIASYAKGTNWYRASLMTALQPWSGAYRVDPLIWVSAHITQFSAPGWFYLINGTGPATGSGLLSAGGSYATLQSPDKADFSIIVEKMSRDHSPCVRPGLSPYATADELVTFKLGGSLASVTTLHLWMSHFAFDMGDSQVEFQYVGTVPVSGGSVSINVTVDSMYTLTTVATGNHGSYGAPPTPTLFPSAYVDSFDNCPVSSEMPYFNDQNGAFECYFSGDASHAIVMRQMTPLRPISWGGDVRPHSLVGHIDMVDVSFSMDVFIEVPGATAAIGARCVGQDDSQCVLLLVDSAGNYNVTLSVTGQSNGPAVAAGKLPVPFSDGQWATLRLDVNGSLANAWINGVPIFSSLNVSDAYPYGFAYIGVLNYGDYSRFDNVALFSTQRACGATVPAAGAPVSLVECETEVGPRPGAAWEYLPSGQFALRATPALCLSVAPGTPGTTWPLSLAACDASDVNQLWARNYTQLYDSIISNPASNTCLDISGGLAAVGVQAVTWPCSKSDGAQQFYYDYLPGELISIGSGVCLGVC